MQSIEPLLSALGQSVLQFLWQGTVIALLAGLALATVSRADSGMRHTIGLGALLLSLVAFGSTLVSTFVAELALNGPAAGSSTALTGGPLVSLAAIVAAALPNVDLCAVLAWGWIAGVLFMALRHRRGVAWGQGLRRTATALDDPKWQQVVDSLCVDLGLRRVVRILQSARIESPAVIGWLAPIIVVPVSAFTGLTAGQLRSVLAHELAHIRRHDHLVNAVLALIEVSLFFHPATWWFAGLVRREREHCCDLAAIRVTGNPRLLARALAELESLRLPGAAPVLAARSSKGPLMQRITRILSTNADSTHRDDGSLLRPALLLAGLLACAGIVQSAVADPARSGAGDAAPLTRVDEQGPRNEKAQLADRVELERVAAELKAAVAAGKLSGDDARAKLRALKAKLAEVGESRRFGREDYARVAAELKAAVVAGKITGEQARARLEGMRRMLAEKHEGKRDLRAEYTAFENKIGTAVKSGEMTELAAKKAIEHFRRR
ncbi:MAG: beta-lactamase regulating signal transducer with metallopeptidase domain, partial [Chlamydiales bacterium]